MNKIERKLRKIKGLYGLLNNEIRSSAVNYVNVENSLRCKSYPEFVFEYDPDFACFDLKVFKNQVVFYYTKGLIFGNASGLDFYTLLDVFYGSDKAGFTGLNSKYFNECVEYLTKFVRKALKDGLDSMEFGMQTEQVKVTDYLDFKEKQ